MDNPSSKLMPSEADIEAAFVELKRLEDLGLIEVGRPSATEGWVSEPLERAHRRVISTLAGSNPDMYAWTTACWIVASPAGRELAREYESRTETI